MLPPASRSRLLRRPGLSGLVCAAGFLAAGLNAQADDATKTPPPASLAPPETPAKADNVNFWTQDTLTGDWGGLRKQWEDKGVSLGALWVGQGFRNFAGGMRVGNTGASTFDFNITLDGEKLFGWAGAKFYADFEDHAGPDPSLVVVGDLQKFTKYNAPPFSQIAELWYEQKLFGNKVRLKIGKVDANTEFSLIDNGLPFLTSATQVTPTLLPFATYPDPQPSVNIFFTPDDFFYASLGAYYANRGDHFLVFSGHPYNVQSTQGGVLFLEEVGMKWEHLAGWQTDGNFRLGFWEHTGDFPRLDGGEKQGTHGFYAIVDQTLWNPRSGDEKEARDSKSAKDPEGAKKDDGRGVRMFLEYAQTPGDVSVIDRHIGGGLSWTGLISSRPKDMIGFSIQYVHLSADAGLPKSYEQALEGFYRWQLTPWAALQPDLQFVINAGGQYPSALVGAVDVEIHF